ncbi:MAG TPA: asparagine synthase (glutamine-hydrolyzing) [Candidatus Sulfotelmatobacter sp.]|nr:asparagine synthase (glutamine-hydrolyzing) [Candidatus Sulfotelmatobacter sp.]
MCGIVAIFSKDTPVLPETVEKATRSLRHRGPDGQNYWLSSDCHVALGHARLSIIDLTTGDQPIANEDGSMQIIVNGEFYGYELIQKELIQRGHRLRTQSDSEIALHLYEESGVRSLEHLRGEFAIVLWDNTRRTLFAARDRFGIKPLFYAFHDDTLFLASEAKALFAAGVPARWSQEAIYDAGGFGGPQSRTLFQGIFQIPPGHYMVATETETRVAKYWDFDYPKEDQAPSSRSDVDYAEEFLTTLEEAVRLRLRADVPVGCYLSGGIDSCAVLGLAARHHPGAVRAFTLTFDRQEYNEEAIAREMAVKAGAEFFPVPMRQDELGEHFADAIAQAETLCVNSHGVAKYLLSRAVRNAGYKVVLTGEGSDEILGGYLHFRRDMSGNGAVHPTTIGRARPLEEVRRFLGFVPGWMETSAALSLKMHGVFADDFIHRHSVSDQYASFFNDLDVANQLSGRHRLNQSLYLWSKTRLSNYLLVLLGDRMEMANSVEGRVPFLDHRVVEVMRSQPVTQKIRGATQKFILREAARSFITDTVYRRPKHPFLSPPATLDPNGRLAVYMQDTLHSPILSSMPFFDKKKISTVLDNMACGDENARVANDQVLMMTLSACVLQDRYRLST